LGGCVEEGNIYAKPVVFPGTADVRLAQVPLALFFGWNDAVGGTIDFGEIRFLDLDMGEGMIKGKRHAQPPLAGFDPFGRCNINGCKRSDLSAPGCLKETLRLSVPPLLAV